MKRTILIVEDTDECRETLEMSLSRISGLKVLAVSTAEEALGHAASGELCALVTDLRLPQMSGFELIEFVRSLGGCSRLPVLVVSGENDLETRARVAALGADAFFAKPFSPNEVRREAHRLIAAQKVKRAPFPEPLPDDYC